MESNELQRHLFLQSFCFALCDLHQSYENKLDLDLEYFKGFSPVIGLLCCDNITRPENNYTKHDRDVAFFICTSNQTLLSVSFDF